jgi:hypothetical protein
MTIPQIITAVGWFLFSTALAFGVLHTVNLAIPHVDYFIPSSEIGLAGYFVAGPIILIGFALGMIGQFFERIEEWWLERQRKK